jgi:hypothetical protein
VCGTSSVQCLTEWNTIKVYVPFVWSPVNNSSNKQIFEVYQRRDNMYKQQYSVVQKDDSKLY